MVHFIPHHTLDEWDLAYTIPFCSTIASVMLCSFFFIATLQNKTVKISMYPTEMEPQSGAYFGNIHYNLLVSFVDDHERSRAYFASCN